MDTVVMRNIGFTYLQSMDFQRTTVQISSIL